MTTTLIALFAFSAATAVAAPIGPGYPAPGGNLFASSGSAAHTGGQLRTYSGFDTSSFDVLYWGFTDVQGPRVSGPTTVASTSQSLSAGALGGAQIIWDGANWDIATQFGTVNRDIRFVTSFYDMSDNNITSSLSVMSGASVGIAEAPYVLAMNAADLLAWGGGFKVSLAFEVNNGTSWVAVNSYYDSLQKPGPCSGCVKTGTTGAFYYTEAVAPEPASLALFGLGSLTLAARIRRRLPPRA